MMKSALTVAAIVTSRALPQSERGIVCSVTSRYQIQSQFQMWLPRYERLYEFHRAHPSKQVPHLRLEPHRISQQLVPVREGIEGPLQYCSSPPRSSRPG